MLSRMAAIVFIFLCTAVAWGVLGSTVMMRTNNQDSMLKGAVSQLWGAPQQQLAPSVYYQTVEQVKVQTTEGNKTVIKTEKQTTDHPILLDASDLNIRLGLEHRQKGLLWYSVYRVQFDGKYRVTNYTEAEREFLFDFALPAEKTASQSSRDYSAGQSGVAPGGVYDNFRFIVGGKEMTNLQFKNGKVWAGARLAPGKSETVEISYGSQGMDEWWYDFGQNVSQAKNFSLTMQTDFDQIDFPQTSLSPTQKIQRDNGWELKWQYANLLSGVKIGMLMPHKLNPGPWVSEVSFAAPVSLFLFFFVIFMLTTIRKIKLHPMNYFFLGAAFFSFHLLLAYLVDHISIHKAFLICSAVSIFLVVSYLRLAVGNRFAFVEAGILQFVYLVLFSYTFFFERYTGLAITILCILTLFIAMQFTGRVDWDTLFRRNGSVPRAVASGAAEAVS
ncbi:MAG: inner membrane CreD family protein [Blastocatellia bacterium]